jgi:hypothetical protein
METYPCAWINEVSSSGAGWSGRAVSSWVRTGYLIATVARFGSHCWKISWYIYYLIETVRLQYNQRKCLRSKLPKQEERPTSNKRQELAQTWAQDTIQIRIRRRGVAASEYLYDSGGCLPSISFKSSNTLICTSRLRGVFSLLVLFRSRWTLVGSCYIDPGATCTVAFLLITLHMFTAKAQNNNERF